MADIKDCIGKRVKISKGSITIKNDEGKTCGVVRDISSLYDLQANKQFEYARKIRNAGLHGKFSIKEIIVKDGEMYIFRNISNRLFLENNNHLIDVLKDDVAMEKEKDTCYKLAEDAGFNVIECVFV